MGAAEKSPGAQLPAKLASLLREAKWLVLVALAVYLLLVLATFDKFDPAAMGGSNDARLCAAHAEGLGLVKSFRIVSDECLDDGDERTKILADLDRKIRALQSQVDKNCD